MKKLVEKLMTMLGIRRIDAVACASGWSYQTRGPFCYYGICEPIPYGGRECSRIAVYQLKYVYPDGSTCTAPCPTGPGGLAYIIRTYCLGTICPGNM